MMTGDTTILGNLRFEDFEMENGAIKLRTIDKSGVKYGPITG